MTKEIHQQYKLIVEEQASKVKDSLERLAASGLGEATANHAIVFSEKEGTLSEEMIRGGIDSILVTSTSMGTMAEMVGITPEEGGVPDYSKFSICFRLWRQTPQVEKKP